MGRICERQMASCSFLRRFWVSFPHRAVARAEALTSFIRKAYCSRSKSRCCSCSETRDALADTELVEALVDGFVTLKLFEDADHSFHWPPGCRSGRDAGRIGCMAWHSL